MAIWKVPVLITYANGGGPGANVWHIRTPEVGTAAGEVQVMVDAIRQFYAFVNTAIGTGTSIFQLGTSFSLGEVVNVTTQESVTPTWAAVTAATPSGSLPPSQQIVVGWRTSISARRGMGRTFLGPLNQGVLESNGTPTAAALTAVGSAAAGLVSTSLSDANGAVGVYGLQQSAPQGTTDYSGLPRLLRDITGHRVRDKFAVLRSRRD